MIMSMHTLTHIQFQSICGKIIIRFSSSSSSTKPNQPSVSLRHSPADVDNLYGKLRAFTIHISNSMITSSINKITNGWTIKLNTHAHTHTASVTVRSFFSVDIFFSHFIWSWNIHQHRFVVLFFIPRRFELDYYHS